MSRSLFDLHPIVEKKARVFLRLAEEQLGLKLVIYFTYRSLGEQAKLYAKGRDSKGRVIDPSKVVTNARPGRSPHNHRLAFDCVPLRKKKAWWNAPDPIWRSLYTIAEKVGLDALGDPWGEYLSWDKGHFQEPGWKYLI